MQTEYDRQFDLICDAGSKLVAAYTGFSKTEVLHCTRRASWEKLRSVLYADDMYEAIIMLSMSPMTNVVTYY